MVSKLTLAGIFCLTTVWHQDNRPNVGVLLLPDNITVKHNLFLGIKLDTTISLEENLKKNISAHELLRVDFKPSLDVEKLTASYTEINAIVNDAKVKIKAIPVRVKFGKYRVSTIGNGEPDSINYQIKLFGILVADWYSVRSRDMIMNAEIIFLNQ